MKKDIWRCAAHVILTRSFLVCSCCCLFMNSITTAVGQPLIEAKHQTYTIIYDYAKMSPAAVLWTLQASDFNGSQVTKPKYFKMDRLLPKPRVHNDEFSFSHYQRGHLCPSGDRDSRRSWFNDTFVTSNIVPMTPVTNSGAWKETEVVCRSACAAGHRLKIVAGPLWYQTTAVSNTFSRPRVPSAMFKMVVCTIHQGESCAWVVPNDDVPRHERDLRCTVDSVSNILDEPLKSFVSVWIRK